jgi:hypothetical protein
VSKFQNWTGVATKGFSVTPSDSVNFTTEARALYVGGTGNVSLVTIEGDVLVFNSVPAGSILPVATRRVNSTNTTATNMLGIY